MSQDDIETIRGRYANLVWETGHTPDYVRDIMDLLARLHAAEEERATHEARADHWQQMFHVMGETAASAEAERDLAVAALLDLEAERNRLREALEEIAVLDWPNQATDYARAALSSTQEGK